MTDLLTDIPMLPQLPPAEHRFLGQTYDAQQDCARLTGQLKRVFQVFKDHRGEWLTLSHVAREANCPEASASARFRDLKRPEFGAWPMEHDRRPGGLFVYRMRAA